MRPRTFLLRQNGVASGLETLKEIGFYQSDSLTEIVGVPQIQSLWQFMAFVHIVSLSTLVEF